MKSPLAIFSLLLSVICLSVYSQETGKISIAVSDFIAQGISNDEAAIITNRIRSELTKTGVFTVVERGQMETILKEQGFQQSGCTTDKCIVEVGQLLNVKQMVAGSIGKIGSILTISARVIDVATGKIIKTVDSDCKCKIEELLTKTTKDVAQKLAKGIEVKERKEKRKEESAEKEAEEQPGTLVIKTKPAGATVFINSDNVGTTPYSDDNIAPGEYMLELKAEGFGNIQEGIVINEGQKLRKNYTLEKTDNQEVSKKSKEGEGFYKNILALAGKYEIGDDDIYVSLDYMRLFSERLGLNISGGYGFINVEVEVALGIVFNFNKLLFCIDGGYDSYAGFIIRTPILFKIRRSGILLDLGFEPQEECIKIGFGGAVQF
jgi:TolB-like protein